MLQGRGWVGWCTCDEGCSDQDFRSNLSWAVESFSLVHQQADCGRYRI